MCLKISCNSCIVTGKESVYLFSLVQLLISGLSQVQAGPFRCPNNIWQEFSPRYKDRNLVHATKTSCADQRSDGELTGSGTVLQMRLSWLLGSCSPKVSTQKWHHQVYKLTERRWNAEGLKLFHHSCFKVAFLNVYITLKVAFHPSPAIWKLRLIAFSRDKLYLAL